MGEILLMLDLKSKVFIILYEVMPHLNIFWRIKT